MNILFWGLESPPHQGGIGVYMMTMAQALVSNGHRVTWITAIHPGCPAEKEVGGVHLRRCYHPRDIRSRKLAENLCAIAREMRADWIEGADHLGECATLLALRRRPPVLIKAHGPQCLWRIQKTQVHHLWQTLPLAGALLKILPQLIGEWKCLERADALLAPGPSMLSLLRAHGIR
ncbi:MAG: glycosyltransferase, partial [Kiritimatiellia bacterium]|nr:glycosyltransferase [Kiritimatiellia bacterium]